MNISKTRFATILLGSILATAFLVSLVIAATPTTTFNISGGLYPQATVTIWNEGNNYFAKNIHGQILYSGTTAATVIEDAWSSMNNGGTIKLIGDINLGSNGIHLNLTRYVSGLILSGEGETRTELLYTGSSYALIINTTDASIGFYYCKLENFLLNCSSINTGRHGILIDQIGRTAVIDHVKVYNADRGISTTTNTNELYIYNCRFVTCNVGFYKPDSATNEITFTNTETFDCKNYGFYIWGGSAIRFYGGLASSEGIGIYLHSTWGTVINGVYFHHDNTGYIADLYLNGTDATTYSVESANIEGCYFNGGNYSTNAIILRNTDSVKIDSCVSRFHTSAFIHFEDVNQETLVINPNLLYNEYLFSGSLTQTLSRLAGTVITTHAIGVIAATGNDNLTTGDIVTWNTVGNGVVYTTNTLNDTMPCVVMFPTKQWTMPTAIAVSGIMPVNNASALSLGDRVITYTTSKTCTDSNITTDPTRLIGYVVGISSTTPYVKIQS